VDNPNPGGFNFNYFHHQDVMGDAIEFTAKNNCVNVIAAGNSSSDAGASPAETLAPESYAIQVGASDAEGVKLGASNFGFLDVLAPGDESLVVTTSNVDDEYQSFVNTSCATPHVAGVAALMITYINGNSSAPNQLHPEDVEFLIEKFAYDIAPLGNSNYGPGYDARSGFGLVDAGNVLSHIELPYYKVHHFQSGTSSSDVISIDEDVWVYMEGISGFTDGSYLVDAHLLQKTISFNVGSETVLDGWQRDAHGTLRFCENVMSPYSGTYVSSVTQNDITVEGCVYHIIGFFNGNTIVPMDSWFPHAPGSGTIAFSIYTHDETINVEEANELGDGIVAYPNPTYGMMTITTGILHPSFVKISIFDSKGSLVEMITPTKQESATGRIFVELSGYPQGIYNLAIAMDEKLYNTRVVKQ
jgi:hypothetical protein